MTTPLTIPSINYVQRGSTDGLEKTDDPLQGYLKFFFVFFRKREINLQSYGKVYADIIMQAINISSTTLTAVFTLNEQILSPTCFLIYQQGCVSAAVNDTVLSSLDNVGKFPSQKPEHII